jgi:hypothetical protein
LAVSATLSSLCRINSSTKDSSGFFQASAMYLYAIFSPRLVYGSTMRLHPSGFSPPLGFNDSLTSKINFSKITEQPISAYPQALAFLMSKVARFVFPYSFPLRQSLTFS